MANLLDEEWKLVHIIVIKGNLKVDSAITLTKSQPDLLVLGSLETKNIHGRKRTRLIMVTPSSNMPCLGVETMAQSKSMAKLRYLMSFQWTMTLA